MSRRPARCTQADIARAIAAVKQSGVAMRIEILPDGTVNLWPIDDYRPRAQFEPHSPIEL